MTSTRDAERHPYFLFKNFGKYRENVGINRFCMYVEGNEDDHSHQPYAEADKRVRSEAGQIQAVRGESRRIRPVERQPCRIYRCEVVSRPRQDVQTRKGKHWNERQPNDTAHANDRDGNGLRDREHAGRPGAGPIRAVRPSPDRRRSDGVSRELSCKPYVGSILHTIGTAVFIHGTSPKGTERR